MIETDVIVVGGGPVGMLLAAELGTLGVNTVVVERNPEPVDQPRAGTMHARTVQSLLRRGYVRARASANPFEHASEPYPFAGMPGMRISSPATEGPTILHIPQVELERMISARASAAGARVLRNHEVVSVGQESDRVTADVRGDDGMRRIEGRYVVGADGARSLVRESIGFPSSSHPATLAALISKVRVQDPSTAPAGWQYHADGWTRIDLNPSGYSRVMTFDFSGPAENRRAPVTLDELQETFRRISRTAVEFKDPQFLARFSDFSRLATEYRRDRAFLAGDAAHVHFPIGGQGLNLGIQDALNLGWKLAAAVTGTPDDHLLNTYHLERHPAARRVLENTRAQISLMRPDPDFSPLRNIVGELLPLPEVSQRLGNMISDQEVAYGGDGTLVGSFQVNVDLDTEDGTVSVAELLESARPVVVMLDGPDHGVLQDIATWEDRLTVVVATCRFQMPWRVALIRPDGYLAWTASREGQVSSHLPSVLADWFGG